MPSKSHKPATSAGEAFTQQLTPSKLERIKGRIRARFAELLPVVRKAAEQWRGELIALGADLPASLSIENLERLARVVEMSPEWRESGDWTAGDILALAEEWVAEQEAQVMRERSSARIRERMGLDAVQPRAKRQSKTGRKSDPEVTNRDDDWLTRFDTGLSEGTYETLADFAREVEEQPDTVRKALQRARKRRESP